MEKLKVKHDHTFTDIVKVAIFSLFLLLPLFVFAPTAFYYGFNEHAKNETTTEVEIQYKYETNEISNYDDFVLGNVYYTDGIYFSEQDYEFKLQILNANIVYLNNSAIDFDIYELSTYDIYLEKYDEDPLQYLTFNLGDGGASFISVSGENVYFEGCNFIIINGLNDFKLWIDDYSGLDSYHSSTYNEIESVNVQTDVNQSITQQMYNAWQTTWQSPLFNWTGNNNFTFTIKAFTNVFGITEQSYLTNYINYLLTLTAVYVIFDIVIVLFTKMTHLLNG